MGYLGPARGIGGGGSGGISTKDITLYVRSTGNDSNDGLTVGSALRQIDTALSKLPKNIVDDHQLIVDAQEAASFNGFCLADFSVSEAGRLQVLGLEEQPTLTTGTATGTATGGFFSSLTDSGQNWTANELVGKIIEVDNGSGSKERSVIRFNTATSINFSSTTTFSANGKDYEILDQKTTINTLNDDSDAVVKISNCKSGSENGIEIKNLVIDGPAATPVGLLVENSTGWRAYSYKIKNSGGTGVTSVSIMGSYGQHSLSFGYVTDSWTNGMQLSNNPGVCRELKGYIYDLSGIGLSIDNVGSHLDTQVYVESCGGAGVSIKNCQSLEANYIRSVSSTGDGVLLENCKVVIRDLGGTGNSLHGLNARLRVYLTVANVPAITGTSGDATDDRGTSAITWATDLASDGNLTSNTDYQVTIERDDSI